MAQKLAGQFQPTKDGVRELMKQQGKGIDDLRTAINALQNPIISNFLNRISPNITQQLQNAGNSLISDFSNSPVSGTSTPQQPVDSLTSIQQRLNAMR